jgi:hypothetical protein
MRVALDRTGHSAASAADDATARESWGPLHGVPMTVKDVFETADLSRRAGRRVFAYVPWSTPWRHCLDAGAVIFGKTNSDEFARDADLQRCVRRRKPLGSDRTVGGSSRQPLRCGWFDWSSSAATSARCGTRLISAGCTHSSRLTESFRAGATSPHSPARWQNPM